MSSFFIGFIGILAVILAGLGKQNFSIYMQPHSIIIVGGGSLAILLLSTPNTVLRSLFKSLVGLVRDNGTISPYRQELLQLVKNRQFKPNSTNALINYASELWEQGVEPELFIVLLSQRRRELESRMTDAVQALKNLAKYPPALGMMGTVIGMVAMFAQIDANKDNIGTNLSLAMTATFFGLVLTNALISPLADRLQVKQVSEHRVLESIYEILLLINRGEPAVLIEDEMEGRVA